jgi:hypothetical protein
VCISLLVSTNHSLPLSGACKITVLSDNIVALIARVLKFPNFPSSQRYKVLVSAPYSPPTTSPHTSMLSRLNPKKHQADTKWHNSTLLNSPCPCAHESARRYPEMADLSLPSLAAPQYPTQTVRTREMCSEVAEKKNICQETLVALWHRWGAG